MFPGAFDPPHNGHVAILEAALKVTSFDEVWIVPSGKRDDKLISTSYDVRHDFGVLFVEYLKSKTDIPIRLITAELDDTEGKQTHEILKEIRNRADAQVTQLIGSDGFLNIHASVATGERFIVVSRPGYELPKEFVKNDNVTILDGIFRDISSTKIRDMIHMHDMDYKALIPKTIASFIEKSDLYKK